MKRSDLLTKKILPLSELTRMVAQWKVRGKTFAFTNGVFDILHPGHIFSLTQAASEADYLVVAVNTDASVKRLKGESRPINDEAARALLLAALVITDAVVLFDEDTPLEVVQTLLPDVIVKGGDYTEDQIVGATEVKANGGRVVINPILDGFSTTAIIEKMQRQG